MASTCTVASLAPEFRCSVTIRPAAELAAAQLQAMAEVFSAHYGVWGGGGPAPGARVRLSATRLRASYLTDDASFAAVATDSTTGAHIGHATYRLFPFQGGIGMWVSQLVVHRDWRGRKVASQMLGAAVATPHNLRACGLASSHPHAVRAMEKAVGVRCSPAVVAGIAAAFLAASGVSYVQGKELRIAAATDASPPRCSIDTAFFVDHGEVDALRVGMPDWQLGPLVDGEEFLAIAVRP